MKKIKSTFRSKAKLGARGIIIIILIIVAVGISSSMIIWYSVKNKPIRITRNSDFKLKYSLPGSGTKEDPYRIENRQIITKNRMGIDITNTSKHFIIQNCNIVAESHCIFLSDVGNGTVVVRYNTLSQISIGYVVSILIVKAPYCIFANNTFVDNINSGCSIADSPFSLVVNNSFSHVSWTGISSRYSDNITIASNVIINTDLVKTNLSKAISVFRLDKGEILNNTISGLFDYGIKIRECTNVDIFDNHIDGGGYSGAYIYDSDICSFTNNTFEKCDSFGLVANNTNNLTINSNVFNLNVNYAILLNSSSYNNVYHNTFIDNNIAQIYGSSQAFDDGTENNWFDTLTLEGNFWSELEWNATAVYLIDGGSNVDNYPLETPIISLLIY